MRRLPHRTPRLPLLLSQPRHMVAVATRQAARHQIATQAVGARGVRLDNPDRHTLVT